MTFAMLLTPLLAALALTAVVSATHHVLPPWLAVRLLVASLGAVLLASVPTLWLISLGYVAHHTPLGGRLEWCAHALGIHGPVPHWAGAGALALSAWGTVAGAKVLRSYRRLRSGLHDEIEVAAHPRPFAYTLPGPGGHVVVSSGLLDLLDDDEQAVVLAHERAHGRHRHDRLVLVARLAATAVPVLVPLTRRLQFALERWADEEAARQCGDRAFVARTLGKVALHQPARVPALGWSGLGVTARVAALLAPPVRRPAGAAVVALWASSALAGALAVVQLHHLGGLLAALCVS